MDEMISRSAAIEAIEKHIRTAEEPYQLTDADKVMNHAFEIAASCVYNLSATEADVPDINDGDMISRQAAIEAVHKNYDMILDFKTDGKTISSSIEDILSNLPSAQPERMRGKWIYGEDEYGIDGYHCNQCGFFVPWDYAHKFINYIEDYHFCPNCGADMREDEQE